ncbi:MAG: uncharacterized protein QOG15_356 [Solirubrobacteraceae bacterium]|nr:uncharacterized protein [Solirubrobacteraceae bacterium]
MTRAFRSALVVVVLGAALCATAVAPAAHASAGVLRANEVVPLTGLAADASREGVVNLIFFGRPGARVYFDERVGAGLKRLGDAVIPAEGAVIFPEAVVWRCDRLVRSFQAVAASADGTRTTGTFDVRTPSCASRFELDAPRRIARGGLVRVRMIDGWQIGGIKPRLCITPPAGRQSCKTVKLDPAVGVASRRFRATKRGLWRLVLRVDKYRVRTKVAVGGSAALPGRLPVVLAAGDSTMQGIDSFLADGLAHSAIVRSEVLVGSGVSTSLGWVEHAPTLAERDRPRVTVVSIGANDASDMPTPDGGRAVCCGESWVVEYARRVRTMMKAFIQKGRGRVFWLALPVARDPARAAYGAVVNVAMQRAAAGLDRAQIIRIDQVFTPNGYRDVMRWRGRDVQVRAPDGIHLSAAGTAIAAEVIQVAIGKI